MSEVCNRSLEYHADLINQIWHNHTILVDWASSGEIVPAHQHHLTKRVRVCPTVMGWDPQEILSESSLLKVQKNEIEVAYAKLSNDLNKGRVDDLLKTDGSWRAF